LANSRAAHCTVSGIGPTPHRQHDVERLASVADVLDQAAAESPVVGQLAQRILATHRLAALVLDLEPTALAGIAEVRRDGLHAPPAARHLDHHLRRSTYHGRLDPFADGSGHRSDAHQEAAHPVSRVSSISRRSDTLNP
jgi:hypothetical protein